MEKGKNVSDSERIISSGAGAAALWWGMRRRGAAGFAAMAAGGMLLKRGLSGRCDLYSALGINKNKEKPSSSYQKPGWVRPVTIRAPRQAVYEKLRDVNSLLRMSDVVREVRDSAPNRRRLHVESPFGGEVVIEIEIYNEHSPSHFSWRTLGTPRLPHQVDIVVRDAPANRGTEVHASIRYLIPGGELTRMAAKLGGYLPERQLALALRRVKQLIETGEVARISPQPSARKARRTIYDVGARVPDYEEYAPPSPS